MCAAITNNSLTGSGQVSLGGEDTELDQTGSVTYELPAYTGPSYNTGTGDATAGDSFVQANNPSTAGTPSVLATSTGPGGFSNTPGPGAACPAPS